MVLLVRRRGAHYHERICVEDLLRDEAHRYAIGTHRARRQKAELTSPLDGVPGIGPKRKKALLAHFGSARAVSAAGLQDLEAVDGISKAVAQQIFDWFYSGKS